MVSLSMRGTWNLEFVFADTQGQQGLHRGVHRRGEPQRPPRRRGGRGPRRQGRTEPGWQGGLTLMEGDDDDMVTGDGTWRRDIMQQCTRVNRASQENVLF